MSMAEYYQMGVGLSTAPTEGMMQALEIENMKQNMGLRGAYTQQIMRGLANQQKEKELATQIFGTPGAPLSPSTTPQAGVYGAGLGGPPMPVSPGTTPTPGIPAEMAPPTTGLAGGGGAPTSEMTPDADIAKMIEMGKRTMSIDPQKGMTWLNMAENAKAKNEANRQRKERIQIEEGRAALPPLQKEWDAIFESGDKQAAEEFYQRNISNPNPLVQSLLKGVNNVDFHGGGKTTVSGPMNQHLRDGLKKDTDDPQLLAYIDSIPDGLTVKAEHKRGRLRDLEVKEGTAERAAEKYRAISSKEAVTSEETKWAGAYEKEKKFGVAKPLTGEEEKERYRKIVANISAKKTVSDEDRQWAAAFEKEKTLGPMAYGEQRIKMIMEIPVSVYDTHTGNIEMRTREEVNEANKANQKLGQGSRYVGAELATKIKSKVAMFNEIEVSSKQVNDALKALKGNFTQIQLAKFSNVMKVNDDGSALTNFIQSNIGKTLTPDELNYVTAVKNLRESAFALRSLSGMGQGSDMLRKAIEDVVPGAKTPSKEYAFSSLKRFDTQVSTLKKGIPGLGSEGGKTSQRKESYSTKKASWIERAKAQNPESSEEELSDWYDTNKAGK